MIFRKYFVLLVWACWLAFVPGWAQVKLEKVSHYAGYRNPFPNCGATFEVDYLWVDKESATATLLNQAIGAAWHGDKQTPEQEADAFINAYKQDFEDAFKGSEIDTLNLFFMYESKTVDTCLLNTPELLVLSRFSYIYAAGAHGTYGTDFLNLDVKTGQVISLEQLFKPDFEKLLAVAIEKAIRKSFQIPTGQRLAEYGFWTDQLPLPDAFGLTREGLRVIYGLYNIAPYAMGEIDVTVSYQEIKALLRKKTVIDKLLKP
ncbi:MAG TPA: hypothetical protein DCM08_08640 [Microscillaceae bacterium]|nr:hypothetical protein [Microscillaceae bacterium]